MAKDRKPDSASPARGGGGRTATAGRTGSRSGASTATARPGGKGGRTRPPTQVVSRQRRPWGLIAAAVAVVVFAAAVLTYATLQVQKANANKVTAVDQIAGIATFGYPKGQTHVATPVNYPESPPVGGQHDPQWADCTGTVYSVDIRNENAVHSLEHGATWITYNPDRVDQRGIDTLSKIVDGTSGVMLSPRPGLDAAVSVQSWNNQLKVDSATDKRIQQFVDFLTFNPDTTPELGATCENPQFITNPVTAGSAEAPAGGGGAPSMPPAGSRAP